MPIGALPGIPRRPEIFGLPGREIPNLGQLTASTTIEGEREGRSTFQAAPVRKPLSAVSSVNDKGNLVIFVGAESFIIPGKESQVAQLRKLIQAMAGKIKLHLKSWVYTMRVWKPKPAFTRQGR